MFLRDDPRRVKVRGERIYYVGFQKQEIEVFNN